MHEKEGGQTVGTLAQDSGNNKDPAQIADEIVSKLREVEAVLSQVIGEGGVAALFRRSLFLTVRSYPHLAGIRAGDASPLDHAALKSELAQLSSVNAAEFGAAFTQTLSELMTSLVGASLTERLLGSVWSKPSIETPAQDDPS